ncbi:hypothetical protein V2J09_020973 [Rumex salicifolius]
MGDFNETMSVDERSSDSNNMRRRCERFFSWVDEMGLIDLGFSGSSYTWAWGRDPECRTTTRLDRGLCNFELRDRFVDASIKHLPMMQSDHTPLLFELEWVHKRQPSYFMRNFIKLWRRTGCTSWNYFQHSRTWLFTLKPAIGTFSKIYLGGGTVSGAGLREFKEVRAVAVLVVC